MEPYPPLSICPSLEELAHRRKLRHAAFALGVARAYVLVDAKAHLRRGWVELIWDEDLGYPQPPTECQMRDAGAPKAAIERLCQGHLGIEGKLGRWTGEFFLGLKLSRAFSEKEAGHYRIDPRHHPELVADIQDWVLAGRLGRPDRDRRRRLVGCLAATHLPAEDPQGAGVIAGLFAGARLSLIDGEQWFELPDDDGIKQLLASWTILHYPSRRIQRRDFIRVSPFHAALFADLMPARSQERALNVKKSAMCPLLPLLYWEVGFSLLKKGMCLLPFADALPYGCSRRTFFRRAWRRKGLHRKAVLELGILSIDPRLKNRMHHWFEKHQIQRVERLKVS